MIKIIKSQANEYSYIMICLYEGKRNSRYLIKSIKECEDRARLMELGFVSTLVTIKAIGYRKGVFLVGLRGFEIIISGALAKNIEVE